MISGKRLVYVVKEVWVTVVVLLIKILITSIFLTIKVNDCCRIKVSNMSVQEVRAKLAGLESKCDVLEASPR